MTVAEVRRCVQQELKDQCDLQVPIDRLRLRKKIWKSPCTILCDAQKFDTDIPLVASTELFAEVLPQPERVRTTKQARTFFHNSSPYYQSNFCVFEVLWFVLVCS